MSLPPADHCNAPLLTLLPPTSFQSSSVSSHRHAGYYAKLNNREAEGTSLSDGSGPVAGSRVGSLPHDRDRSALGYRHCVQTETAPTRTESSARRTETRPPAGAGWPRPRSRPRLMFYRERSE
ncbi:contactin-associated protein-like 5 isoform X2 [Tachysurus ichikawai]